MVAVHDPASGRLTYACAGHPPPEVKGGPEPFEPVTACSAPPFGVGEATGFRQSTFTVPDGARACFRTHGLTDERVECAVAGARDAQSFAPRVEELEVDEREVGDALERFLRVCDVRLAEVPGVLRAAGEAARRDGSAVVRVRIDGPHPDVDVVPGNVARPAERRGRVLR